MREGFFGEVDWWRDITWGYYEREETLGGAPHGYIFVGLLQRAWRKEGIGGIEED